MSDTALVPGPDTMRAFRNALGAFGTSFISWTVTRKSRSIAQPEWSPDGGLYFVSDRTEWWSIYRLASGRRSSGRST